VILAMIERLEQLESAHGIIEMYDFVVHHETVLNGCSKSKLDLQRKNNLKLKGHLSSATFYCVFFPRGQEFAKLFYNIYHFYNMFIFVIIFKQYNYS
jgi:hypothetical protein